MGCVVETELLPGRPLESWLWCLGPWPRSRERDAPRLVAGLESPLFSPVCGRIVGLSASWQLASLSRGAALARVLGSW